MIELHKRAEQGENVPPERPKREKKQSPSGVILYITVLFTVVFLLILLSYFMHSRQSESTITELQEDHAEFRRSAQEEIDRLTEENAQLRARLEEAEAKLEAAENKKETTQKEGDNND